MTTSWCLAVAVAVAVAAMALAAPCSASAPNIGRVFTVAGSGPAQTPGLSEDAGPATDARFAYPLVGALPSGGFVVADSGNNCLRHVDPAGQLQRLAGTCMANSEFGPQPPPEGDDVPAPSAVLASPFAPESDRSGRLLFPERNLVSEITTDGKLHRVAGSGNTDFSGDGMPAREAGLGVVSDVAWLPDGGFLVADGGHGQVRRVLPDGTITTVAGSGERGYAGDGGPATTAKIEAGAVALLPDGGFLIGASTRVRRVWPDGNITTIAGNGLRSRGGPDGDGGPALAARLTVADLAATPDGGFLFVDQHVHRVRYVDPQGIVHPAAGRPAPGFSGDGGSALGSQFENPGSVALYPGGFLIADSDNNRIRFVEARTLGRPGTYRKLAAALLPIRRIHLGRRVFVRYSVTRRTRLVVHLQRNGHPYGRALRARSEVRGGRVVFRPSRRGRYEVKASFSAGGQVATARAYFSVTR